MTHLQASCLCGSIQIEACQKPFKIGYCHCGMCRKHTGAPFSSFSIFKAEDIHFSAPLSLYASSAQAKRGFCRHCGSSISWHGRAWGQQIIAIQTGLFKQAKAMPPQEHWYVGSALPWVNLNDDLLKNDAL